MTGGAPAVGYPRPVRPVRFLRRTNRYLAEVRLLPGGPVVRAHVPNPGRMEELLVPGETTGYAVPVSREGRSTGYDLVSVRAGGRLVSIDTRVANRMVGAALRRGQLRRFGPGPWRSEVRFGASRLDFGVPSPNGRGYSRLLEVKSSNLRVGSTGLFPDAPTDRGRRHLQELARAARTGVAAGVLFLVQRDDVQEVRPNAALDPEFARAMERAGAAGVQFSAQSISVRPGRLEWGGPLPVRGPLQRF